MPDMDVLELLESISKSEATTDRLFGGLGTGMARRRSEDPKYQRNLRATTEFVAEIIEGRRPVEHLRLAYTGQSRIGLEETMTRSDFPLLFGDVIDRVVLGGYRERPATWPQIANRGTVRDFRLLRRFYTEGGDNGAMAEVKEVTEYPAVSMVEAKYDVSVKKYGRRMAFSWETLINDDLNQLRDAPVRLGRAARRSEERFVTDLYVGPAGPDATLYSVGNANIITGNPALSLAGLQTALTMFSNLTDQFGEPIWLESTTLVVPPSLEIVAMNILNAINLRITGAAAGAAANTELEVTNWMRGRLKLVVNPYISAYATSNQTTSWWLFADPIGDRAAIEIDFLRGREQPELFQKLPDAVRIGGGGGDLLDGSFELDIIEYKARHVFGGGILDPKLTMASNGSGA